MEYLGSNFSDGTLAENEKCVVGFDNAGFAMGTSSSLFNQFILQVNGTSLPTWIKNGVTSVLTNVGNNNADVALYTPNPFYQYHPETNENAQSKTLVLVDGGENLENIPLHPLIEPLRQVDVVFAIESSADTSTYWPNGTSMVATYQRSLTSIENGTTFPAIPPVNTFLNLGLNSRPTFFGCNSSNMTGPSPIIVYLPNSPYTYLSNVSTFQLSYNDTQRNAIVLNGYNVVTRGNGTVDADWSACVGCVILSRSFERTGTDVPEFCQRCFQTYCWDGTLNNTTPKPYEPPLAVASEATGAGYRSVKANALAVVPILVFFILFS
jgi:lysophospholipase